MSYATFDATRPNFLSKRRRSGGAWDLRRTTRLTFAPASWDVLFRQAFGTHLKSLQLLCVKDKQPQTVRGRSRLQPPTFCWKSTATCRRFLRRADVGIFRNFRRARSSCPSGGWATQKGCCIAGLKLSTWHADPCNMMRDIAKSELLKSELLSKLVWLLLSKACCEKPSPVAGII